MTRPVPTLHGQPNTAPTPHCPSVERKRTLALITKVLVWTYLYTYFLPSQPHFLHQQNCDTSFTNGSEHLQQYNMKLITLISVLMGAASTALGAVLPHAEPDTALTLSANCVNDERTCSENGGAVNVCHDGN